jgi:hypothetical protein
MSEYQFEPYQKVLVRDGEHYEWKVQFFSHQGNGINCPYVCVGGRYEYCLPYEGNEHLLGTTNDPEPKWTPKKGEIVKVKDNEDDNWLYRCFIEMTSDEEYECYCDGSSIETVSWKYCEPLTDEEKG